MGKQRRVINWGGQAAAIEESTNSNACHAIGDCDGNQAETLMESTVSYACHTIRNCD